MISEKSIVDKLNFNKYPAKLILNKPEDINDFNDISYDSTIEKEKYDVILIFIFHLEEFSQHVQQLIQKQLVADKGYVFFAYPKKNNPQYDSYIDRDSFFKQMPVDEEGYIQDSNLKFAKMVSMNDVFTVIGLKSEVKKTKKTSTAQKSQRVDDYIDNVEDIKLHLKSNEELLQKYNELAFGYQKDWARYVYSAKKKETQEKRLVEMESILAEGYKSIDLYRLNKK
ncbi:YdeI/OmpD-associated family protein [Brevibacillus sp. SYSU BS000544]|uniref:YdeI/OmpD-associated family protein n=1 Tax=Brevibacillus sp. SYSU BS000544 TaxID=3416443 RepID=UPI003CE59408